MKEPRTLQEAIRYFADPDRCVSYLMIRRWPDGVICPNCGSRDLRFISTRRLWECKAKHAKRQFSVKVGTIFEDSPIGLDKWLCAFWMVTNCRNGVSSHELHRTIGVTQKSAWFMLHRIRLAMQDANAQKLGRSGGPIETDETFVGPTPMRMHKSRRARIQAIASNTPGMNRRAPGKTIVMGMLDRDARQVRAMVVPDVKRSTLQEKILNSVSGGAKIVTDDFPAYKYALADKFVHEVVNHTQTYVEGQVHTNGIENFWSLLKRGLRGTYVAVEPFHLDRYVDEQVFRYNHRKDADGKPLPDAERFSIGLSQIVGKRLTFAEVTGKAGSPANA